MFRHFEPYGAYRDSGVVWLPSVPAHWATPRLKSLVIERTVKNHPKEPLLAATQSRGVILKSDYEFRTVVAEKSLESLKLVEIDDFVISLRSFQGGIESSRARGIISPAYTVLRTVRHSDRHYLGLLFKTKPFIDALKLTVTGIREGQNIDYARLARDAIPMPPMSEQVAIVRFLGVALSRIDRAISAKRKLIALLNEQRRAIVHSAVTRGLETDTPMKDSGVPWAASIPAHWESSRIGREFEILDRLRVPLSSEERGRMENPIYDYYGASGVIDKVDDFLFDEPSILIAEDGANLVLRNLPLAVKAMGRYWVNNHAHVLRPRRGNLDFLAAALEVGDYRHWITGAAQPKLTQDRLRTIPIAVPPPEEQARIAEAVLLRTSDDGVIDNARREIELLREFRTRLTADVVTGQVDVREIASGLLGDVAELPGPTDLGTADDGLDLLEQEEGELDDTFTNE